MNDCRFDVIQAGCDVAALSKIGVLVDGTGNEAGYFGYFLGFRAEDERKTGGEGGRRLHGRESKFGNVVATKVKSAKAKLHSKADIYLSVNPNVPLIWLFVVRFPNSRTLPLKAAAYPPSTKSVSANINVFLGSNPTAMISMAF